jgi:glycosyltransferase involved in cell wall biosynthesis
LPIAEAMCVGVPALATDWSASAEYVNETNGYPIRAALTPVRDPQSKYRPGERWAEPDIAHAAARLREAATDAVKRQARGAAAREAAVLRFSAFDLSALYGDRADLHWQGRMLKAGGSDTGAKTPGQQDECG